MSVTIRPEAFQTTTTTSKSMESIYEKDGLVPVSHAQDYLERCRDDVYLSLDGTDFNDNVTIWLRDSIYKHIVFDFSAFPKKLVITHVTPPVRLGDVVNRALIRGYRFFIAIEGECIAILGDEYFEERR